MIKNRTDLKYCLNTDCRSLHKRNLFFKWLSQSEEYYPIIFMKYLRYTEYYINKNKRIWDYIPYFWCLYLYRRLKQKTGFYIMPNTVDEVTYYPSSISIVGSDIYFINYALGGVGGDSHLYKLSTGNVEKIA